jgi:phospholipid/cholesterol/gamma-HCH transport system substrate-binding protein
MKKSSFIETFIGFITLIFVIGLVWNFSNKYFASRPSDYQKYTSYIAKFNDIDGLSVGSEVKLGGVIVGKLIEVRIDEKSYKVIVKLSILDKYKIPDDSILSVGTNGLIGEKYLRILIGNSDNFLVNDAEIEFTQSALNLENLIGLLRK